MDIYDFCYEMFLMLGGAIGGYILVKLFPDGISFKHKLNKVK